MWPVQQKIVEAEQVADSFQAIHMQEARKLAKTTGVGLVIRRGGKSCLGLLGVKEDEDDSLLRKRWIAKGIPSLWFPTSLVEILEKQQWRVVEDVQPPKK